MKYLKHPMHGVKPFNSEAEARADMLNGWTMTDVLPSKAAIVAPVSDDNHVELLCKPIESEFPPVQDADQSYRHKKRGPKPKVRG